MMIFPSRKTINLALVFYQHHKARLPGPNRGWTLTGLYWPAAVTMNALCCPHNTSSLSRLLHPMVTDVDTSPVVGGGEEVALNYRTGHWQIHAERKCFWPRVNARTQTLSKSQ